MKLQRLHLTNYRRFDSFEIDFQSSLTVIAARNGQGKTTILEAIAAALGPFVGAFDDGKSKHIDRSDARYKRVGAGFENEQIFPVLIDAEMSDPNLIWQRALNGPKGRTTTKEAVPLANFGGDLVSSVRVGETVLLPVVCYYSSRRLWVTHKITSAKAVLSESRMAGYEDCLSSSSNYSQIQLWLRKATYAAIQQRSQSGYEAGLLDLRLKGISEAVNFVLSEEGWNNFHYSLVFEELAMSHPDHGALPVSMLSDGVRAVISLVADLALRCVRLNGYLHEAAPKKTPGIVLIDEVDLHLHPAWQQKILTALRDAFPSIQFIVTTHSPQVVSTVPAESIRVIVSEVDRDTLHRRFLAVTPQQEVEGTASSNVLSLIFNVDPVPDIEISRLLSSYMALIQQGLHEGDIGKADRAALEKHFGSQHPLILECDRLARVQDFKRRLPSKQIDPSE
ncbi:MAG: AAA family ATPase [Hyphomonas sp.]